MAESDGGHVWPPRASDLRIQEFTGAGPEASTPDHVFVALRALGYTGTLDDMWNQHLAALAITDTSEPFTTALTVGVSNDWQAPSNFSQTTVWDDAGGAGDLSPILDNFTTRIIDGIGWSGDGLNLFCGGFSQDIYKSFVCSTAFDPTTATLTGGTFNPTWQNASSFGWFDGGTKFGALGSTDTYRVYSVATPYTMEVTPTLVGDVVDTALGKVGSNDGPINMTQDGNYIVAILEAVAGLTHLVIAPLSTAYDPDTVGTLSTYDIETNIGFLTAPDYFTQYVQMNNSGTVVYVNDAGVVKRITLSTPYDATSAAFDSGENISVPGTINGFSISDDAKTIMAYEGSTLLNARIIRLDR